MKRLLVLVAVALLALPAAAEETAKPEKKAAREVAPAAATAKASPGDSPLVAAAKRTKRGAPKATVITDETVKKSTGRLTTSDSTYVPVLPAAIEPSAEVVANEQRAKARADEQKKARADKEAEVSRQRELARKARLAEQAEEYEDGYDDDADPASLERDLAAEARKKPQ